MEVVPGILMDADIRFGKPCLVGTRIDVTAVLGALAADETVEMVAADYELSTGQVLSALLRSPHRASADSSRVIEFSGSTEQAAWSSATRNQVTTREQE